MKNIFNYLLATIICLSAFSFNLSAKDDNPVNKEWQAAILAAVDSFPERGGYYTGRKSTPDFKKSAWRGMNDAFNMRLADQRPNFDASLATPSFCSLATYGALIQAILIWDKDNTISRNAWLSLKPLLGVADNINQQGYSQRDGEGCWGRANANGPGVGVLVKDLKVGFNFHAYRGAKTEALRESKDERYLSDEEWNNHPVWEKAIPGDFMKIFWDRNESHNSDCGAVIGMNDNKNEEQERGHAVIFMGYDEQGNVKYWSSNGPGKDPANAGYCIAVCPRTKIQRVVFSRITKPENFERAKNIRFNNVNKWLDELNGKKHGTTKELLKECGIK